MQTFLPYKDFISSAECLDYKRLGKQRIEARQILNALTKEKYGWQNHPAVKMWKSYEKALIEYGNCCIREWVSRGYKNSMEILRFEDIIFPPWLGDDRLHSSHRSNLLRKDEKYYFQFGWLETKDLPYYWPAK